MFRILGTLLKSPTEKEIGIFKGPLFLLNLSSFFGASRDRSIRQFLSDKACVCSEKCRKKASQKRRSKPVKMATLQAINSGINSAKNRQKMPLPWPAGGIREKDRQETSKMDTQTAPIQVGCRASWRAPHPGPGARQMEQKSQRHPKVFANGPPIHY